MSYFLNLIKAAGEFVDKVVPVGVGSRTQVAVIACPVLGFASTVASALYPPAAPVAAVVVPLLQKAFCTAAVPFAAAGVIRRLSK